MSEVGKQWGKNEYNSKKARPFKTVVRHNVVDFCDSSGQTFWLPSDQVHDMREARSAGKLPAGSVVTVAEYEAKKWPSIRVQMLGYEYKWNEIRGNLFFSAADMIRYARKDGKYSFCFFDVCGHVAGAYASFVEACAQSGVFANGAAVFFTACHRSRYITREIAAAYIKKKSAYLPMIRHRLDESGAMDRPTTLYSAVRLAECMSQGYEFNLCYTNVYRDADEASQVVVGFNNLKAKLAIPELHIDTTYAHMRNGLVEEVQRATANI